MVREKKKNIIREKENLKKKAKLKRKIGKDKRKN